MRFRVSENESVKKAFQDAYSTKERVRPGGVAVSGYEARPADRPPKSCRKLLAGL